MKLPTDNRKSLRPGRERCREDGFTLIELITAMLISLVILGVAVATFSAALHSREREASRVDALTSAQAALNVMSREIGNSGFGLKTNGLVLGNSDGQHLRVRSNVGNNDGVTEASGEDITFFYDLGSESVIRYDANTGFASGVINRVSRVDFQYFDYVTGANGAVTVTGPNSTPTLNTARVNIKLTVTLPDVVGQPNSQRVTFNSDITLRNAPFMRNNY